MSLKLVNKIFYRNYILYINFLEDMQIEGEDGIANPTNYLISINGKRYRLDGKVNSPAKVIDNKSVLFQLSNKLRREDEIRVGYVNGKKIQVVKSTEGDINCICPNSLLIKELEYIDISNSYGSIIDGKTVRIEYKGNNKFSKVSKYDFYIEKAGVKNFPIDCFLKEDNIVHLVFNENFFSVNDLELKVNVVGDPLSLDILDENILKNKILSLKNNIGLAVDAGEKPCLSLIKNIFYKNDTILLNYTEDMELKTEHGIANISNYLIKADGKEYHLEDLVKVNPRIIGKRTVIFYLNKDITSIESVTIGYTKIRELKFVRSNRGNIHCICAKISNINSLEPIDISNSYGSIINEEKVLIEYKGNNLLGKISKEDFYVEIKGEKYYPINDVLNNKGVLFLTFQKGLFFGKEVEVKLKVKDNPKSTDIVDENILGNKELILKNNVSTKIESLSMVKSDSGDVTLRVSFTRNLLNFDKEDFTVLLKDTPINIISATKIFKKIAGVEQEEIESVTLLLKPPIAHIDSVFKEGAIKLVSKGLYDDIITIDINKKRVYDLEGKYSRIMRAEKLDVSSLRSSLIGAEFIIEFSRSLNEEIVKPTMPDGKYIINPGEIKAEQGIGEDYLIFKNINIGKFIFKKKKNATFIIDDATNNKEAIVEIKENTISVKLSEEEAFDGKVFIGAFSALERITYEPDENIFSTDNIFIYNWTPWFIVSVQRLIYVPPLANENSNPFNGGILYHDYIIELSKDNIYRYYGSETPTEIEGYVNIVGEVNDSDKVILKNLNIKGDLIISAVGGDLNIDGGSYKAIRVDSKL